MAQSTLDREGHTGQHPIPRWNNTSGPASVVEVMQEFDDLIASGNLSDFRPLATGFDPLDDVLNGGLRPGELMVMGGPYGVGKTILALQIARNAVQDNPDCRALYICYEHERTHMLSRLLCLESAEQGNGDVDSFLTLRRMSQMSYNPEATSGLLQNLRRSGKYDAMLHKIDAYADRLILAKANGAHTTLDTIEGWIDDMILTGARHVVVVVDYLQKVAVNREHFESEEEIITYLMHGLKDIALEKGIHIIAIAASDRLGLRSQRMRFADMRGSSAVQYEADIRLMLNNKYDVVSREHLIYNLAQGEAMRNWVVMSVEKNRAGRHAVDMEYALDAAHFRILPKGDFVRERLVDEKAVKE